MLAMRHEATALRMFEDICDGGHTAGAGRGRRWRVRERVRCCARAGHLFAARFERTFHVKPPNDGEVSSLGVVLC